MKLKKSLNKESYDLLCHFNILESLATAKAVEDDINEYTLTEQDKEKIHSNVMKANKINSTEEYQEWLDRNETDKSTIVDKYKKMFVIENYRLDSFENSAKNRYLDRKNQLDKVVYSLIRVGNPYLARELYLKITDDGDCFGDIAAKYSEGPERDTRGIIGPTPISTSHPVLAELLRSTQEGIVTGPIQLDNWNIIVRVEKKIIASFNEQTKKLICKELYEQCIQERSKNILNELELNFN